MIQIIKKLNSQKGSSIVQLVVSLAMVSVIVGGIPVVIGETLNDAKDIQRIANLRQLATTLELYYLDNQNYPQIAGASSNERFSDLLFQLSDYLASFPTGKRNYDYQDLNSGQNYILKVNLEDSELLYSIKM